MTYSFEVQVKELLNRTPYAASVDVLETLQATCLHMVGMINDVYYDVFYTANGDVLACNVEGENNVHFAPNSFIEGSEVHKQMTRKLCLEINSGLYYAQSEDDGETCDAFFVADKRFTVRKQNDVCPYVAYDTDGSELEAYDDSDVLASHLIDLIFE